MEPEVYAGSGTCSKKMNAKTLLLQVLQKTYDHIGRVLSVGMKLIGNKIIFPCLKCFHGFIAVRIKSKLLILDYETLSHCVAPTPISLITFSAAPFFHHAGPVSLPRWDGPYSHQALAYAVPFCLD